MAMEVGKSAITCQPEPDRPMSRWLDRISRETSRIGGKRDAISAERMQSSPLYRLLHLLLSLSPRLSLRQLPKEHPSSLMHQPLAIGIAE